MSFRGGQGGSRTAPTREGRKASKGVRGQVLDPSRGLGMTWQMGARGGGRDELAVQGRPPLDPSRASATVVIVKGILDSKELVV